MADVVNGNEEVTNGDGPIGYEGYNNGLFDPSAYLKHYYQMGGDDQFDGWDYLKETLEFWRDTFAKEENSGDELLELGTGPNLIASTFASRRFKKIYLSDYSEANNDAIRKWINKEEGAWNWSPLFEQVAKMENHPGGGAAIEARLRAAIQDVYQCDVTKENPLEPLASRQFAFVVAAGLFEAIAKSDEQYKQLVSNAKNVIAPGGTFLVDGDFGESFYYVNGKKFHVFNQSEELVRTTFTELGFGDITITFEHRDHSNEKGQQMFDAQAYFHMSCKRLA